MTYKGYEDVGRDQPPVYFRNTVTGEVLEMPPGPEVAALRDLWHPQIPHRNLWEQISADQARTRG